MKPKHPAGPPMTLGNMRDRQICMSALIYIKFDALRAVQNGQQEV